MIANVFSVDRFDGVSGVRPGQASKSVAPNGVNPFAVRDTVSFSAEALGLAQGMGLAQNGAEDFTVSRSAGETADPASGAATNAALQKNSIGIFWTILPPLHLGGRQRRAIRLLCRGRLRRWRAGRTQYEAV